VVAEREQTTGGRVFEAHDTEKFVEDLGTIQLVHANPDALSALTVPHRIQRGIEIAS
jgi:hypothetical protein